MESLPNLFPDIHNDDREALIKDIDMVEVKESLFNIGGLKALGIKGFPACFYQTTPKQAGLMKRFLENFCKASGQAVNFEKYVLYCSPNTSKVVVNSISAIYGSPVS
ncbi:hypothetical protein ACFX11_033435 [Malus domestica]